MSDLTNKIKAAQMLAGEESVIDSLKEKGLLHKEDTTEDSKKFFELFRHVREEIAGENGYHLAKAIMLTFDRWNKWNGGLPEFDGKYLVLINQKQECGNIWKYQKVIECFMNRWVLEDESEDIIGWKYLSSNNL